MVANNRELPENPNPARAAIMTHWFSWRHISVKRRKTNVQGFPQVSVTEVAHAGKDHGHTRFIGGGNDFLITHGAAWLNHGGNAFTGRCVNGIAEREEGIGCHDRALDFQSFIRCLDAGNTGTVHAAHLTSANTNGPLVASIDNGIGLDEFADLPGKHQVTELVFCGLAVCHDLQVCLGDAPQIGILYQQTTIDTFEVQPWRGNGRQFTTGQDADVRPGGQSGQGIVLDRRCNNDFDKLTLNDPPCVCASSVRLKAMIPPKAEAESVAWARW